MAEMEAFVIILLLVSVVRGLGIKDIVVIILSQENEHHLKIAENLKEDLHLQAEAFQQGQPIVHLSHRDFSHVGDWTILPLIPQLQALHKLNSSWMFFVEDRTKIKLKNLVETLSKYNQNELIWLGHALHDEEATIIHHFAFYDNPRQFQYPNFGSGVAISITLIKSISHRLSRHDSTMNDFGIDSAHELALFLWDKGRGQTLTHEPALCVYEEDFCATFPTSFQQCGNLVPKDSIYFAVKTCGKYHHERVPVVKHTWAQHATKIDFFSDISDNSIPTVTLGVPNTEQGHCGKTMAILHYIKKELRQFPKIQWIVVADDDTILGVSRIQQVLTCYNSSKLIALGERYGYNVQNEGGYNYITGGGGMVFSETILKRLTEKGVCECPSISAPDDMFLGMCISRLGVSVIHSPLFHQARPIDYPPQYLKTGDAVSFHKHWMIDPVGVYNKWFAEEDLRVSKILDLRDEL